MEDHLSSTAVMLVHMELKYENKLVEMEGKYDKKLKEMEKKYKKKLAANDNKLLAFEERMKECEDRMHTYESRMQTYRNRINKVEDKMGIKRPQYSPFEGGPVPPCAFWKPEMVVEGCGIEQINGNYEQKGELFLHNQSKIHCVWNVCLHFFCVLEYEMRSFCLYGSVPSPPPRTDILSFLLFIIIKDVNR